MPEHQTSEGSRRQIGVKQGRVVAVDTVLDGADVNAGTTTDAGVTGNNTGTLSAKIRGLNTILADRLGLGERLAQSQHPKRDDCGHAVWHLVGWAWQNAYNVRYWADDAT